MLATDPEDYLPSSGLIVCPGFLGRETLRSDAWALPLPLRFAGSAGLVGYRGAAI